jgi:hypothetical protein
MATGKKVVSSFGPPPLLKGEDLESYAQLLAGVKASVDPADFLEEMWTRCPRNLGNCSLAAVKSGPAQ